MSIIVTMKKLIVLVTILLLATLSGWLLKDRLLYHYDVWRMTHAVEENEIIEYNEKIQTLQDKIVNSCFVNTYNDTTKPNRVRRAAAMALIKSDVTLAETLFKQHLDSTNPEVSGMAIRDLGAIKSKRYKNEILHYRTSSNEIVRWSVVDYLGHFNDGVYWNA
jgi:HEAT repeat protein